MLGFGDKAVDLANLINPIEHSKTKELANKYKVEPFVIAADVYGSNNLAGNGGWTWYTGSASWYYMCILKNILGLKIEDGFLTIEPSISKDWEQYEIRYKYGESVYNIKIKNPDKKNGGVSSMFFNGDEVLNKKIKLADDGSINEVEVIV